ncbi:DUF523 domain-containing protein [Bacillus sp. M6-12]|uniref:DUF523 domain-containing protein n=1 Tax=Bacillus sp. M6-12 TaxID=2054166 RepID=UPI0026B1372C|nr:DUF523 domain-containing protein [Bacillus sp. M6-12]
MEKEQNLSRAIARIIDMYLYSQDETENEQIQALGDEVFEWIEDIVVLKENSPSCGSLKIYNGEFIGEKIEGMGVTSALLKRNGLRVISEEQFAETFF